MAELTDCPCKCCGEHHLLEIDARCLYVEGPNPLDEDRCHHWARFRATRADAEGMSRLCIPPFFEHLPQSIDGDASTTPRIYPIADYCGVKCSCTKSSRRTFAESHRQTHSSTAAASVGTSCLLNTPPPFFRCIAALKWSPLTHLTLCTAFFVLMTNFPILGTRSLLTRLALCWRVRCETWLLHHLATRSMYVVRLRLDK